MNSAELRTTPQLDAIPRAERTLPTAMPTPKAQYPSRCLTALWNAQRIGFFGGQQVLEIKTPSGTLRKFFCFDGWDVYRRGALDKKRRAVAHV